MCSEFGAKVVNMKGLLKSMPGMFKHSDKNVRAEVSGGVSLAVRERGASI